MNTAQILKDSEDRMEKALDVFRNDLKGLRTGRASPQMLDALRVDYYGSPTPIKQHRVGDVPGRRQRSSSSRTRPTTSRRSRRRSASSDLGLAPNNDGKVIRLSIPAMSGDQRKKIVAADQEAGRGREGVVPEHPPRRATSTSTTPRRPRR